MDWKDVLSSIKTDGTEETPVPEETPTVASKAGKRSVTLFYERKGRGGKEVTILGDFAGVGEDEIRDLASMLKKKLGVGGSCRGGEILIQGNRVTQLRDLLNKEGYKVKG